MFAFACLTLRGLGSAAGRTGREQSPRMRAVTGGWRGGMHIRARDRDLWSVLGGSPAQVTLLGAQ